MSSRAYRVWLAGLVIAFASTSGGWLLSRGMSVEWHRPSDGRLFDAVFDRVLHDYVDSIPESQLFQFATVGLLRQLRDPYTLYLPPERLARLTERTSGNYIGIGAQVQRRDDWPLIVAPYPGSPAERAGLRTGDRIVEIDGASTRGWTVDETVRALRGPPGTTVRLVVERPGLEGRLTFTLTRGGVHRRAVARTGLLRGDVGYVDVNFFNDSTEIELQRAIDSLKARGMRSLILDLRGNPGGVLTQGTAVADLFLDSAKTIVRLRGRTPDANRVIQDTSAQRWPDLILTVLIDEGSASASEIVAGALQDHDRALIVGRRSFGKGSAQGVFALPSGGAVKLTTSRWFTPSGRSIDRLPLGNGDPGLDETERRPDTLRSSAGRPLPSGGGIVPDVVAGDTALTPGELALEQALGTRAIEFRNAMGDVAIRVKARNEIGTPDFEVTQEMLDELLRAARARGLAVDRSTLQGARSLVARLLAREIARYVFGPQGEVQRSIRDDPVIQLAARLSYDVRSQQQLFERATLADTARGASARR